MARKKAGERRQENYTKEDIWWMMNDDEETKNPWHSMFRLHTHKTSIFLLSTCSGPWKVILSQPARETRKKHEKTFKIHPTSPLNHLKLLDVKDSFSHCSSEIRSFRCLPIAASELVTQIAIAKGRPSLVAWVKHFIYFLHFFFFSIFFHCGARFPSWRTCYEVTPSQNVKEHMAHHILASETKGHQEKYLSRRGIACICML